MQRTDFEKFFEKKNFFILALLSQCLSLPYTQLTAP